MTRSPGLQRDISGSHAAQKNEVGGFQVRCCSGTSSAFLVSVGTLPVAQFRPRWIGACADVSTLSARQEPMTGSRYLAISYRRLGLVKQISDQFSRRC